MAQAKTQCEQSNSCVFSHCLSFPRVSVLEKDLSVDPISLARVHRGFTA